MSTIDLEKPAYRMLLAVLVAGLFGLLYWLVRAELPKNLPVTQPVADIAFVVLVLCYVFVSWFYASIIRIGFTLAITGLLCWAAWYLWNKVPRWLRRTEFSDFNYVASLAAIFVALSLANPILLWIWSKLTGETKEH